MAKIISKLILIFLGHTHNQQHPENPTTSCNFEISDNKIVEWGWYVDIDD